LNEASEETSYTLVAEGSDVYADLRAAQAAALPAVARALADFIRARAGTVKAQVCKEQPEPYEV
jgi:hypothetical protein